MDFPVGAKSIELGELGSVVLFPAALVFMAIGKISGWQPLVVPHWVVVTKTFPEVTGEPVIRPTIGVPRWVLPDGFVDE
jgi:hypothetical protein